MGKRGPKSTAELAVIEATTQTQERLRPPAKLSQSERAVWLNMVNAMSAAWFEPENQNLMVSYCRDVMEADRISQLIDRLWEDEEGFDTQTYKRLVDARDKIHASIRSAETKLGVTPQIRSDNRRKPGKTQKVPWDE